jgi:hypothetical protein
MALRVRYLLAYRQTMAVIDSRCHEVNNISVIVKQLVIHILVTTRLELIHYLYVYQTGEKRYDGCSIVNHGFADCWPD